MHNLFKQFCELFKANDKYKLYEIDNQLEEIHCKILPTIELNLLDKH